MFFPPMLAVNSSEEGILEIRYCFKQYSFVNKWNTKNFRIKPVQMRLIQKAWSFRLLSSTMNRIIHRSYEEDLFHGIFQELSGEPEKRSDFRKFKTPRVLHGFESFKF